MIDFWRKSPTWIRKALLQSVIMALTTASACYAHAAEPERMAIGEAPLQQASAILYFTDASARALMPERLILPPDSAPQDAGRAIVEALVKGPRDGSLSPSLPAGVAVKGFYITPGRTAVVDLDSAARDRLPGGVMTETLSVFSIVNSLILNISDIEQVKVIFDGQEAQTFAGHIDLESPLKANILLIK